MKPQDFTGDECESVRQQFVASKLIEVFDSLAVEQLQYPPLRINQCQQYYRSVTAFFLAQAQVLRYIVESEEELFTSAATAAVEHFNKRPPLAVLRLQAKAEAASLSINVQSDIIARRILQQL